MPLSLIAQDKLKTKKINSKTELFKTTCEVLKADNTTKHGAYERAVDKKQPLVQGQYERGKRAGLWNYYDYEGNLIQQYNHTTKELLFHIATDLNNNKAFRVKTDSFNITTKLERVVLPIGGYSGLNTYFYYQLRYPPNSYQNNVEGDVVVSFMVNTDGSTSNFNIKQSLDPSCEREAIRLLKNYKEGWIPAMYKGQEVPAEIQVTIKFLTNFKQLHPNIFKIEASTEISKE